MPSGSVQFTRISISRPCTVTDMLATTFKIILRLMSKFYHDSFVSRAYITLDTWEVHKTSSISFLSYISEKCTSWLTMSLIIWPDILSNIKKHWVKSISVATILSTNLSTFTPLVTSTRTILSLSSIAGLETMLFHWWIWTQYVDTSLCAVANLKGQFIRLGRPQQHCS